jgi:hypothetical protein
MASCKWTGSPDRSNGGQNRYRHFVEHLLGKMVIGRRQGSGITAGWKPASGHENQAKLDSGWHEATHQENNRKKRAHANSPPWRDGQVGTCCGKIRTRWQPATEARRRSAAGRRRGLSRRWRARATQDGNEGVGQGAGSRPKGSMERQGGVRAAGGCCRGSRGELAWWRSGDAVVLLGNQVELDAMDGWMNELQKLGSTN